ncbi:MULTISPECIES: oxidative damage protection protein [Legionella]|uniref:oxidative damage protection protein n=1 Tax=Legionella TaxID=445 RepID=UPI000F8E8F77|nr:MULTISPECIES: oxidative damage protection protein [Legionella]MCP0913653.1 oxidative damage protection protein [Legionella sp. 27cVA30]RUQ96321.1 oxidative damage protection protein [Legionella septentrionalis]RUR09106.1 oxidative damage protection protein [Legionella septentrionalis]RUR14167.1 oxidative damage protection protein [Legionella septentrionalis]
MSRQIFCIKLGREAEGMTATPFPGPLGEKIYNQISKQAWKMWLDHQTMLINEYRLSLLDPKAREFLREEMQKYFFGEGSEKPAGYSPDGLEGKK